MQNIVRTDNFGPVI